MDKNKMDEDGGCLLCANTFKSQMENYSFDQEMHQSKMV